MNAAEGRNPSRLSRSADTKKLRRCFIGGSDARIIMGGDEAAFFRLWREKRGEVEPEDLSGNLIVQLGLATEDLNRRWYAVNTGEVITDIQKRVWHPALRWMAATLDGRVQGSDAVFEAKFMLPWSFSEEAAAEKYMPQLQHRARAVRKPSEVLESEPSAALRDRLMSELKDLSSAEEAAIWVHRILGAKNSLIAADAERIEQSFRERLEIFGSANESQAARVSVHRPSGHGKRRQRSAVVDKSVLTLPAPRRVRDRNHVKFVAKQPCLICGRRPADAHHLRFAQLPALGRKVSDEFTVPLCRGHHREAHRCGDETAWWGKAGVDPTVSARALWLKTHPLPAIRDISSSDSSMSIAEP
jgi:hypothetical protein